MTFFALVLNRPMVRMWWRSASSPSAIICAGVFALIAYLVGNRIFADYLQLNAVPGVGELAVFCSALIGAGMGFLWFNAPPAAVFMGDIGSLALGGALGAVAVATKHEFVLMIVGGLRRRAGPNRRS